MITVKKLNKKYGKRKIQVFEDNKKLGEICECCNWIYISNIEHHDVLRKIAIENLWWLLHSDNPERYLELGYTEEEVWKEACDKWNKGRIYGVSLNTEIKSNFFPGEYEIALNSINNK